MVHQSVIYAATIVGAIALLLMLPRKGNRLAPLGLVLGAAAVGAVFLALGRAAQTDGGGAAESGGPGVLFYVLSFIGLGGAVRVVTHPRPVYSALYFILVVVATAGLFLTLAAEFMAFALVVVYAGAILVTYLFVIMLAREAPDAAHAGESADYDARAREPIAAVAAGFVLLAAILGITNQSLDEHRAPWAGAMEARNLSVAIDVVRGGAPERPENVEQLGRALFAEFPVSFELAGVILMLAMFGAVILARRPTTAEESG